jgi:drug/metabolite transporter (DMT)-like permease
MASTVRLGIAFAIVYLVWGSTYLVIRIAVHDIPPGLLAGIRFVIAGVILGALALARGERLPASAREWQAVAVMSVAMIVIGNGAVHWAEQFVPSNLTALIISSSALWTAWFGTFGPRAVRLTTGSRIGLAIGMIGVLLLVWPQSEMAAMRIWALGAIVLSSLAWSAGAIYGRGLRLKLPPLMFAAMQMLMGGGVLWVIGLSAGQMERVAWTSAGIAGMLYLTIFGSCVAYATYVWLIRHATPARLSTIAYVNPVVAAILGWLVLDESLEPLQITGTVIILLGVILVASFGGDSAESSRRQR